MTQQKELLKNYENLDLEQLPAVICKNGYEYRLLERDQAKCLYAQVDAKTQQTHAYEVFKNRINDNHQFIKHINAKYGSALIVENYPRYKEVFPANEDFGMRAWTFRDLNLAKQKFNSLR